jgi:hypothetical protein
LFGLRQGDGPALLVARFYLAVKRARHFGPGGDRAQATGIVCRRPLTSSARKSTRTALSCAASPPAPGAQEHSIAAARPTSWLRGDVPSPPAPDPPPPSPPGPETPTVPLVPAPTIRPDLSPQRRRQSQPRGLFLFQRRLLPIRHQLLIPATAPAPEPSLPLCVPKTLSELMTRWKRLIINGKII